jgi:hypothetical protein
LGWSRFPVFGTPSIHEYVALDDGLVVEKLGDAD